MDDNVLNSIVCCLPNVIHLDLSSTSCSNETLAYIAESCPNLESLDISLCSNVNDTGMEILRDSKLSLKVLRVLETDVSGNGCREILSGMSSLERVTYDNLAYYLCWSDKQYNLTELTFSLESKRDVEVLEASVKTFPKLKKIRFAEFISVEFFPACCKFENLEELQLNGIRDLTLILPLSKKLKSLILVNSEITVSTLIENFENLRNLHLDGVSFIPFEKKEGKVAMTKLNTLVLKNMDMDKDLDCEANALLISVSKNVTQLHISYYIPLPYEILAAVSESKSLTLVYLHNVSIWEVCLKNFLNGLFEIPTLHTIIIDDRESEDAHQLLSRSELCTLSWRDVPVCHSEEYDFGDIYRDIWNQGLC